jgi:hypothetical protein
MYDFDVCVVFGLIFLWAMFVPHLGPPTQCSLIFGVSAPVLSRHQEHRADEATRQGSSGQARRGCGDRPLPPVVEPP